MKSTMEDQLTKYVIRELGRHQHPEDVVKSLAFKADMDWTTATKFVNSVSETHSRKIGRRRAPFLMVLAVCTMVFGAAITIADVIATSHGSSLRFPGFPIPYSGNVAYFITGVSGFFGGLIGIFRTIRKAIW